MKAHDEFSVIAIESRSSLALVYLIYVGSAPSVWSEEVLNTWKSQLSVQRRDRGHILRTSPEHGGSDQSE
jgi:hypothetical protein